MYILIVEQRISAKVKTKTKDAVDWYTLVAVVIPFLHPGLEIQIKEQVFISLERVVYNPSSGTFWAQTQPVLHPKPNANQVALEFVKHGGWDKAVVEKDLKIATESLTKEAIRKFQRAIVQAQANIVTQANPFRIATPRGMRKH